MQTFESQLTDVFGGRVRVLARTQVGASVLVYESLLVTGAVRGTWFVSYEIDIGGGRIIYAPESVHADVNFLIGVARGRGIIVRVEESSGAVIPADFGLAGVLNANIGWDGEIVADDQILFVDEGFRVRLEPDGLDFSLCVENEDCLLRETFARSLPGILQAAGFVRSACHLFDEYPA